MRADQIKEILARYRPGVGEREEDAEMTEALRAAGQDPELKRWLAEHCQRQEELRTMFRSLAVPAFLREEILSRQPARKPLAVRMAPWIAAAAVLVMLLALWFPRDPGTVEAMDLEGFRARMVSTVLRQYRMEIHSPDESVIRQFLSRNGAPADFTLPAELDELPRLGGGKLSWQGAPVSMVCFARSEEEVLFLFILARSAVPDPPQGGLEVVQVNKLHTTSWSEGDKVYLLAGHDPVQDLLNGR